MFRATSATDRPPSMTKLTASSLYSSVKLRRVEPISETPDESGSYPRCPPKRERSSFVSLLSTKGVRIEDISRLVGHTSTTVTEKVYRHELRPVLTEGATKM